MVCLLVVYHHAKNFVGLAEAVFDLVGIDSFIHAIVKQGAGLSFHAYVRSFCKEVQCFAI